MLRHKRSIVVNAPVEKVFEYLANLANWRDWAPKQRNYEITSTGPLRLGSTFVEIDHSLMRDPSLRSPSGEFYVSITFPIRRTWEVTEFVPNQRLAFESKLLGVHERRFMEIEASNGGARITKGEETLRIPAWILPTLPLAHLFMFLFAPFRWWRERRTLRRLRERLEGQ